MTDEISSQLDNRFKAIQAVIEPYRIVQLNFLVTSTEVEIQDEVDKFAQRFSDEVSPLF